MCSVIHSIDVICLTLSFLFPFFCFHFLLLSEYFLDAYLVLGTVLGFGDTEKVTCIQVSYSAQEEQSQPLNVLQSVSAVTEGKGCLDATRR